MKLMISYNTTNRKYFAVKIFLDSLAYVKIKCAKTYVHYYCNEIQGCLSENYLARKIIARNILDTKYSQFMVCDIIQQECFTGFDLHG